MAGKTLEVIRNRAEISIECLPELVLNCIADFLAPEDVVQLARTCKRLYSLLPRFIAMCSRNFRIDGPPAPNWAPERFFDGPPLPAPVKKLSLSIEWKDQGWGHRKGVLFVTLVKGQSEEVVEVQSTEMLGEAPHEWGIDTAELEEDIVVTQAQPGDFYRFMVNAGGGGGHILMVRKFRAVARLHTMNTFERRRTLSYNLLSKGMCQVPCSCASYC